MPTGMPAARVSAPATWIQGCSRCGTLAWGTSLVCFRARVATSWRSCHRTGRVYSSRAQACSEQSKAARCAYCVATVAATSGHGEEIDRGMAPARSRTPGCGAVVTFFVYGDCPGHERHMSPVANGSALGRCAGAVPRDVATHSQAWISCDRSASGCRCCTGCMRATRVVGGGWTLDAGGGRPRAARAGCQSLTWQGAAPAPPG